MLPAVIPALLTPALPTPALLARALLAPLLAAALAGPLASQAPATNKLEFGNWWLDPAYLYFPNFTGSSGTGGNVAGDGLFKVFPAALFEQSSDIHITGFKLTAQLDPADTTGPPAFLVPPSVQFYRTTTLVRPTGATYETIDFTQPVGPLYAPTPFDRIIIPSVGQWVYERVFAANASQVLSVPARVNGVRSGIAMLVLAPPGELQGPNSRGLVLAGTFQERHLAPGADSYSGSFDAATGTLAFFGELGQPSARTELAFGLRLADPTLQLFGSSAGGFAGDPNGWETFAGPGAYATDLDNGGFFGLYAQGSQFDTGAAPTHQVLPFIVATSEAGPTADFDAAGVPLRIAPGQIGLATVLVNSGVFGYLGSYVAGSSAGFRNPQPGAWASPRLSVPANAALIGVSLWFQGLVVDGSLLPVAATNCVRLTVR